LNHFQLFNKKKKADHSVLTYAEFSQQSKPDETILASTAKSSIRLATVSDESL
jgi:hypothetical protein